MNNKIVIVTGANAGIGKVTARELAKMGAHVVMICRSQQRGEAARQEIINASGSKKVDLLIADLSSQADIRQVAAEFQQKYDRLDVLVNNAGAYFRTRHESVDGFELTFALNHIGYFLLTNLLLDMLKASAPARIVNVSSDAHKGGKVDFDDLQATKSYGQQGFGAYSNSKLMNILFTNELARRLEGTNVTANSLHPGFVASNFAKNNGGIAKLFMPIMHLFAISEDKGAETSIYLASSPEVEGVTGKYFFKKKAIEPAEQAKATAVARQLWEVSEELTG